MPIGTILLILRILGAMPQIIEIARQIYDLIKKIRDRQVKRQMKRELRAIIWDRQKAYQLSFDAVITCRGELDDLACKVKDQLRKEGTHV